MAARQALTAKVPVSHPQPCGSNSKREGLGMLFLFIFVYGFYVKYPDRNNSLVVIFYH